MDGEVVVLPVELVNRVLNYLAQRPWVEVNSMIVDVHSASRPPDVPPEREPGEAPWEMASR